MKRWYNSKVELEAKAIRKILKKSGLYVSKKTTTSVRGYYDYSKGFWLDEQYSTNLSISIKTSLYDTPEEREEYKIKYIKKIEKILRDNGYIFTTRYDIIIKEEDFKEGLN